MFFKENARNMIIYPRATEIVRDAGEWLIMHIYVCATEIVRDAWRMVRKSQFMMIDWKE